MSSLMGAGVELMMVGMGTVFVFLTLLIIATRLMSTLALRLVPIPQPADDQNRDQPSEEELAAITAAIIQHQKQSK